MKILHTADFHLRSDDDERWAALRTVLDAVHKVGADVVAISGDLFDKHSDAHKLKANLRGLFESVRVPVVLIPGNHDDRGLRPGDFFGENVFLALAGNTSIDVDGVRLIGLPFEDVGVDETLVRLRRCAGQCTPDGPNVLLYHGELLDLIPDRGAFGDETDHDYMPVRLGSFDGLGFDYVLAGHFHRGYAVHRYDGGYFVYPGSPVSITRKETGVRHANLIHIGEPPQSVALDTYHMLDVDVVLSPFDTAHPLEQIERNLNDLHPKADAVLTVGGFANLSRVGLTEAEFQVSIRQLQARYAVRDFESRWQDVGDILENELFKRFESKLRASGGSPEFRDQVRDLAIRAMMEVAYAR